jgi:hypothetical protein
MAKAAKRLSRQPLGGKGEIMMERDKKLLILIGRTTIIIGVIIAVITILLVAIILIGSVILGFYIQRSGNEIGNTVLNLLQLESIGRSLLISVVLLFIGGIISAIFIVSGILLHRRTKSITENTIGL